MFKSFRISYIICIFSALIAFALAGCEQTNTYTAEAQISEVEYLKGIVVNNVECTALGIGEVFKSLVTDSATRIEFIRNYCYPSRFIYDSTGYYWAYSTDGVCIANPIQTNLQGKNQLGLRDTNGTLLIVEMINTINSSGRGFVYYYWPHPTTKQLLRKMTYVSRMSPLPMFIGSGLYIENLKPNTYSYNTYQKHLVQNLVHATAGGLSGVFGSAITDPVMRNNVIKTFSDKIRYSPDSLGCLSVYDTKGNCILSPLNRSYEGTNRMNAADSRNNYYIREGIDLANASGSCFIEYYELLPGASQETKKLVYFEKIIGANYIIMGNVYQK